ncbi:hypothetical protein BST81_15270 [Leptolyngbya sp. 'hensonii']|uniref:YbjN domain-containing protein n=1 Tax=Leptolyngbya sp. 'hensonii' TaxID=1922337 RepID=UPI00094F9AAB|nr:YbjN domain-containing protein [Leptolyngbya sp. 'hensonii']OLP17678.1 hypothetical protein BST81_15270 [Leptolyngbya sp. 'hensonii']
MKEPLPSPSATVTQDAILASVVAFFQANDWSFSQHETEPILQMQYQGENGEWLFTVRVREMPGQVVFYSACPVMVPEKKRLAVAEFLTRANYDLIIGNFELDFEGGGVLYKTASIVNQGTDLSSQLIGQLVFVNVMTMDRYLPGLMSVIYANVSPSEAIAQIEQTPTPENP